MSRFLLLHVFYITIAQGIAIDLEFYPKSPEPTSTLIWYKANDARTSRYYVVKLDEFLRPYHTPPPPWTLSCRQGEFVPKDKVCRIEVDHWQPCTSELAYGYKTSTPCIFLTPQLVPGWIPEYYHPLDLPEDMPNDLKVFINEIYKREGESSKELNVVWVSCEGDYATDVENMGAIMYKPIVGFPGHYFPYSNQADYLSPLVAVYFQRPQRFIVIGVTCKMWAKNLGDGGSVQLDILID